MSVEWVRSCYESRWHLFRDDPSRTVKGEYYFSPPGTPFFPGWHNLGSKNWHDANYQKIVTLGESISARQEWDDGDSPSVRPLLAPVGSLDCIERGETIEDAIAAEDLIDGFVPLCVQLATLNDTTWAKVSDYESCNVQRVICSLILDLYAGDVAHAEQTVSDWLGLSVVVRFHPHQGVRNGVITLTTSEWQAVILDGTSNAQEFALQGFEFVVGPTDVGQYSTARLWYDSASYVLSIMQTDGYTPGMKLFVSGHSYGAAVSFNVVARVRIALPQNVIRYLAFAPPKIGDARMVAITDLADGLSIVNDDDLVPILPPDRVTLLPVLLLFPAFALLPYTEWERSRPQTMLRPDGSMIYNSFPTLDTATLIDLLTRVTTGQVIDPISPHYTSSYFNRLNLRCPGFEWPVNLQTSFDSKWAVNAIKFTAQRPYIPNGIVFNGGAYITPPPPPPDGLTCATAFPIVAGVPFVYPITSAFPTEYEIWVVANVTAGNYYHWDIASDPSVSGNVSCRWGDSCASMTEWSALTTDFPFPQSRLVITETHWYWFFTALRSSGSSTDAITIFFDNGP